MPALVVTKDGCRHWLFIGKNNLLYHSYEISPGGRITPFTPLVKDLYFRQFEALIDNHGLIDLFTLDTDGSLGRSSLVTGASWIIFQWEKNITQFALAEFGSFLGLYAITFQNTLKYTSNSGVAWVNLGSARQIIVVSGNAPLVGAGITTVPRAYFVASSIDNMYFIKPGNTGVEEQYLLMEGVGRIVGGLSANGTAEIFVERTNGSLQQCSITLNGSQSVTTVTQVSAPMKLLSVSRDDDYILTLVAAGADKRVYQRSQLSPGDSQWSAWIPMKAVTGLNLADETISEQKLTERQRLEKERLQQQVTVILDILQVGTFNDIANLLKTEAILTWMDINDTINAVTNMYPESQSQFPPAPPSDPPGGVSGVVPPPSPHDPPSPPDPPGGVSGVIPPGVDSASTDSDEDESDEEDGLELDGEHEYVVARFVNMTTSLITMSFRWGVSSIWRTTTIQPGARWMWWTRSNPTLLANLSPRCSIGSAAAHVVKVNMVKVAQIPAWGTPSTDSGVINMTQFITDNQGHTKVVDSAIA